MASEDIKDRMGLKKVEIYISTLSHAQQKEIIDQKDINGWIKQCMNKIIKIDAVPHITLPLTVNKNDLSKQLMDLFIDNKIEDALFRSAEMYWKYWIRLDILDIKEFISSIIDKGNYDFYVADTKSRSLIGLSSEEESYWIFNIKSSEY